MESGSIVKGSLPTGIRTDAKGQGSSRSQLRGEGGVGQAVTWEVLTCRAGMVGFAGSQDMGTRMGVGGSVHVCMVGFRCVISTQIQGHQVDLESESPKEGGG